MTDPPHPAHPAPAAHGSGPRPRSEHDGLRDRVGRWRLSLATIALTLGAFYLLPLDDDRNLWWRVLASLAAGSGLTVLLLRQFRRGADPIARLASLAVLVVCSSAAAVYVLGAQMTGQFEGVVTRTDALYFTVITMATIGYGDIHPVGQGARVLVTLMVVFDLLFVGALGSALATQLRRRFPEQPL